MKVVKQFWKRLFFNLWYYQNPPWNTGISPPELMEFLDNSPPGRALDLGCGTGTNVITMARHGWQASGVDFAPRAISLARRKAQAAGISASFQVGDVSRLDHMSESFDLILDIGCYHTLSDEKKEDYREQIRRLLAPGGTYLLYTFTRPDANSGGMGVTEAGIQAFCSFLHLAERQDGTDRGERRSSWLKFIRVDP